MTETYVYSSIEGFGDFLSTDFKAFFELTHLEVISDFFTLLDTSTLVPTALDASLIELSDGSGQTVRFEGTNFGPINSIADLTAAFGSFANAVEALNGSGTGTLSRLILKDGATEIARLETAPDAWTLTSGVDAIRIEANLPNSLSQIYAMLDEIFDTATGEVDPNYNPATSIMAGYNISSIIAASAGIERARLIWTSTGITATTGDYEFSFTGNLPDTFAEMAATGVALATEAAATGFTLGAGTLVNTLTNEVAASIDFGGVDFATLDDNFPFGSTGNDILVSDVIIATSILGGDGDDFFQTLSNPDFYPFDFVDDDNSWIDGGEGNDTASYINNPVGLHFIAIERVFGPSHLNNNPFIVTENNYLPTGRFEPNVANIEKFIGTKYNDLYEERPFSDYFDGGDGTDHVYFSGYKSQYTLSRDNDGNVVVFLNSLNVPLPQRDVYKNVEWFRFRDFIVSAQDIPIRGGPQDDHFTGSPEYDFISGEAGNDTLKGEGGNDILDGAAGDDSIYGGSENDTLYGADGNDTIDGGSGNDILDGAAGNDSIDGGSGNDTIVVGAGSDTLSAGEGDDLIAFIGVSAISLPSGISLPSAIVAPLGVTLSVDVTAGPGILIESGPGNDILFLEGVLDGNLLGGEGNDIIIAGTAVDLVGADISGIEILQTNQQMVKARASTFDSFDLIVLDLLARDSSALLSLSPIGGATKLDLSDELNHGGIGGAFIFGSPDNEEIMTGNQSDRIESGAGNDTLNGIGGNDYLDGGFDDDSIDGGSGNDAILGGLGNDLLIGDFGEDFVFGDDGNDTINGGNQNDVVGGGWGDDFLEGESGDDRIFGDHGNDTIDGGSQNDFLNGRDGNDLLYGDMGSDIVDGDQGDDTLSGGDGNDLLTGGHGNDSISGGNGNETVYGGFDNDTISGGAGSDYIDGGSGRNWMSGGAGNDFYAGYSDDVIIELAGEGAADTINTLSTSFTIPDNVERVNYIGFANFVGIGNVGDNRFAGHVGADRFVDVAGGNDTVSGGNGSDSMDFRGSATGVVLNFITNVHGGAAAGDVYSSIEKYFGSNTEADSMTGGGMGRFLFTGGGGNDTLVGAGSIDNLQGQAGDDSISGLAGVDSLDGGAGNDTLAGGAAKDYFIYSAADFGQDVITDFQDGLDKLKVHSSVATSIVAFSITGNGSTNVVLTQISSPTNTIMLQSASAITISAADFLFY